MLKKYTLTFLLSSCLLSLGWSLAVQYQKQKSIDEELAAKFRKKKDRSAMIQDGPLPGTASSGTHQTAKPATGKSPDAALKTSIAKNKIAPEKKPPARRLTKKRGYRDTVLLSGILTSNMKNAMMEAGERADLFKKITGIFSWQIDLETESKKGDVFEILFEKKFNIKDMFCGYGNVLAICYTNLEGEHTAYFFRKGKRKGYFSPNGRSLKNILLYAPLDYVRVSSNFSHARLHPILKKVMPHWGIDFAAKAGVPVYASGDGQIEYAKWVTGYGKTVKIQHKGKFNTYYGHLSGYARGLGPGSRVKQGQLIGYVGSTGLATGPHLDYRVEKNGRYINPRKIKSFRKRDLPEKILPVFAHHVERLRNKMMRSDIKVAMVGVPGQAVMP
ncbi:M23 family metallopeptidase [Fibrobacterota bacterium]